MSTVRSLIANWNAKSSPATAENPPNVPRKSTVIASTESIAKLDVYRGTTSQPTPVIPTMQKSGPKPQPIDSLISTSAPLQRAPPFGLFKSGRRYPFDKSDRGNFQIPAAPSTRVSQMDLSSTVCLLGAKQSGVTTIGSSMRERMTAKSLPFSEVLDRPEVFFENQIYMSRSGKGAMMMDKRAAIMAKLSALVFVVDAAATATQLSKAFEVTWPSSGPVPRVQPAMDKTKWLSFMVGGKVDVLVGKPILVLCNKSDMPNCMTAEQLREGLLPPDLQLTGMRIRIQECVANRDIGLEEGFQWLAQQVNTSGVNSHQSIHNISLGKLVDCRGLSLSKTDTSKFMPMKGTEVEQSLNKDSQSAVHSFSFRTILKAAAALV